MTDTPSEPRPAVDLIAANWYAVQNSSIRHGCYRSLRDLLAEVERLAADLAAARENLRIEQIFGRNQLAKVAELAADLAQCRQQLAAFGEVRVLARRLASAVKGNYGRFVQYKVADNLKEALARLDAAQPEPAPPSAYRPGARHHPGLMEHATTLEESLQRGRDDIAAGRVTRFGSVDALIEDLHTEPIYGPVGEVLWSPPATSAEKEQR